jgi:hypothetical protein
MQRSEKLSARQKRFIAVLLTCPTVTEACAQAKLNRGTYYRWMATAAFADELQRQREEATREAFRSLQVGLSDATKALVDLSKAGDPVTRRLAARDVVNLYLRHEMLASHEQRIRELEAIAANRGAPGRYDPELASLTSEQLAAQLETLKSKTIASFTAEELERQLLKIRGGDGDGDRQDVPMLTDEQIRELRARQPRRE